MISSSLIKALASEIGFSDCGIAKADRLTEEEYPLDAWLAEGFNADMAYMERNSEMRRDPRLLVEGARSVISLVLAYKPDRRMESPYKIAQYAYGEDYHERLKRMMYQLIAAIREKCPDIVSSGLHLQAQQEPEALRGQEEFRPFVDTAPISDRHWAVRAGLGWIGKNTLFIHPRYGSYCFLGEIVTTVEVDRYDIPIHESDETPTSPCAVCNLCIDACPNRAIVKLSSGTYVIDARHCNSYNTIENRSEALPEGLNTAGYIFGCDICQLVCPCNKDVPPSFRLTDDRKQQLEALATADEQAFRKLTKHSALGRIKHPLLLRNINKANTPQA